MSSFDFVNDDLLQCNNTIPFSGDGWGWKQTGAGWVGMEENVGRSGGDGFKVCEVEWDGTKSYPVQICSLDHRRKVVSCRTLTPFLCIFILLCSLSPADRNTPIVF